MKKFKVVSLLLVMALCCSLLSGCMGVKADFKINEDGSGTVSMFSGMTKEGMELMMSMDSAEGDSTPSEDIKWDEFESLVINGVTYYGEYESVDFKDVSELNEGNLDDYAGGIDTGNMQIKKNPDGSFTLNFYISPETGDTEEMVVAAEESGMDVETAMIDSLLKDFAVIYNFEFPSKVTQISGGTSGVVIEDNKLSIDLMKLDEVVNSESFTGSVVYTFTTSDSIVFFKDVSPNFWAYNAIMALADGGLVAGIGDNQFNPNGTLTYAQFCQILARATNLETGDAEGYWAYKAIKSCIDANLVESQGEINAKNYNVAIPREAAVSAMYRASVYMVSNKNNDSDTVAEGSNNIGLSGGSITPESIPDFNLISPVYKDDVINAYLNGITKGIDENRTFAPKSLLTRAQVCQLFYNINWVSPLEQTENAN